MPLNTMSICPVATSSISGAHNSDIPEHGAAREDMLDTLIVKGKIVEYTREFDGIFLQSSEGIHRLSFATVSSARPADLTPVPMLCYFEFVK